MPLLEGEQLCSYKGGSGSPCESVNADKVSSIRRRNTLGNDTAFVLVPSSKFISVGNNEEAARQQAWRQCKTFNNLLQKARARVCTNGGRIEHYGHQF